MLTVAQFQVSLCSEDINRSGAQRCLKKKKKKETIRLRGGLGEGPATRCLSLEKASNFNASFTLC